MLTESLSMVLGCDTDDGVDTFLDVGILHVHFRLGEQISWLEEAITGTGAGK